MITNNEVENSQNVVVPAEQALSRRVAAAVVKMAQKFRSDILLTAGAMHIDAKSTLKAFILLEALKGQPVEISARGEDSNLAVLELSKIFSWR